MRIAIWYNLPSGGAKRVLHAHVRGLLARGHQVEIWCPPTADRTYLPLSPLAPEHVVALDRAPRLRWRDVWMFRTHAERELEAMEAHCRVVSEAVKRGGFDVLFANSCMFYGTSPLGEMVDIPSALYLQEPVRWLYEAMPRQRWLAGPRPVRPILHPLRWKAALDDWRQLTDTRIRAREELRFAQGFDRILVNSLFSRESVLRAYGLDAEVCYVGVDSAAFVDQGLPREDLLVGLGALLPSKNLGLVIEALARVPPPRPRLVWIGNMSAIDYVRDMVALAAARGVALELRVGISDGELVATLNRAMALAYGPRLEPFGLAPIEAACCATPTIAVAEGGIRETVIDGQTGLLVPGDAESFAAAVIRLRDDPALARRLGTAARDQARSVWTEAAAVDRIERALARLAAQPSPSNSAVVM